MTHVDAAPELSVVVPVHDEAENVGPLVAEIAAALRGRIAFEMVFVDDASRDGTRQQLLAARSAHPELRVFAHASQSGQSTAVRNGVRRARAPWIATLDGDGQNDPADIPTLLAERERADAGTKCFAGWRVARRDGWVKRVTSRVANALRSRLLRDETPDTGCGLKLFEREAFLDLPYFDHMHRYLPALFQRAGWRVVSVPVGHRPRTRGASKYGTLGRAWVGLSDLRGVAWLIRRSKRTEVHPL
jgi:dolichol-phosphate mannosyltransferase